MDIELGPDECGIDAAKRLFPARTGVQVIFIAGHMEYCTRMYETEHISFLVKPIQSEDLKHTLDRAAARGRRQREEKQLCRSPGSRCC